MYNRSNRLPRDWGCAVEESLSPPCERNAGTMGIKFHCPNGHKLNVKAFLAGKKGICPKCGTKMLIPTVSEAGLAEYIHSRGGAHHV